MKKLTYLVLIAFLSLGCVSDQKKTIDPKLIGVWQMCGTISDDKNPMDYFSGTRLPFFKVLSSSGDFNNMFATFNHYYAIPGYEEAGKANLNGGSESFITGYGTYSMGENGKYIEHVKESRTNPTHNGINNVLSYEFIDDNFMIISYKMEKGWDGNTVNVISKELWVRLQGGDPNAAVKERLKNRSSQ